MDGEATRWVNNWVGLQVSKVVINHLKSAEWLGMTGVPQWPILGPVLFSVFPGQCGGMHNLQDSEWHEMGIAVDTPKGKDAT